MVTGEVAQSLVSNENEQICLEWRRWIGFHQCDSVTVCNPGKKTPAGFPIDFFQFHLENFRSIFTPVKVWLDQSVSNEEKEGGV